MPNGTIFPTTVEHEYIEQLDMSRKEVGTSLIVNYWQQGWQLLVQSSVRYLYLGIMNKRWHPIKSQSINPAYTSGAKPCLSMYLPSIERTLDLSDRHLAWVVHR